MKKYETIYDVAEQYVAVALKEHDGYFDTEEIARDITEYWDGGFVVGVDQDKFWKAVKKHQLHL